MKNVIVIGDSTKMKTVPDDSIHLMVTSPPYPMIKMWDEMFSAVGATSYDQMHSYLAKTWKECYRALVPGGIACINIGDATRRVNDNFKLYPNHARIIEECEKLGFQTLPYILWKKPSNRPNAFLGSGFMPPNAYVTSDCEYILIFRKGNLRKFSKEETAKRHLSEFTKEERDKWFSQVWDVNGVKQSHSEYKRTLAVYPEEIVYRLIRMYSSVDDTVLDPFLGTGTTTKVAMQTGRNSIGYEIDAGLLPLIHEKTSSIGTIEVVSETYI